MSEQSMGPGWWQASDGRWYPPESAPGSPAPGPSWPPAPVEASPWGAPTGYGAPYGAPAWGPPGLPSANGTAIASLVIGIVGVIPCLFNQILAPVALVLGIVVVRKINAGEVVPEGKGLAIAGIVLGAIGTAIGVLWVVALIASANSDVSLAAPGPWS
ncbi:MAG: DUF4190 domain-containing protein [Acidimicrobiales bacterium]